MLSEIHVFSLLMEIRIFSLPLEIYVLSLFSEIHIHILKQLSEIKQIIAKSPLMYVTSCHFAVLFNKSQVDQHQGGGRLNVSDLLSGGLQSFTLRDNAN